MLLSSYRVEKYTAESYHIWNSFVEDAKNGTFLFHRDFMEYHSDRFEDFSLLLYRDTTLVAVFPATLIAETVHSHLGLTYGGLVLGKSIGGDKVRQLTLAMVVFYKAAAVRELWVKSIPVFYHHRPSHEFSYFFSDQGAVCYRRDLNLAIDYSLPLHIHRSKLKQYRKRQSQGLVVEQEEDFSDFWNLVLVPRLAEKHGVKPVHSLAEITLLQQRFPEAIQQYTVRLEGQVIAGITLFISNGVVKSQYGAVTELGASHRALDFLFITLIQKYQALDYRFFDMGTVTEDNWGLLKQKEELGCEVYTQDFYKLVL